MIYKIKLEHVYQKNDSSGTHILSKNDSSGYMFTREIAESISLVNIYQEESFLLKIGVPEESFFGG